MSMIYNTLRDKGNNEKYLWVSVRPPVEKIKRCVRLKQEEMLEKIEKHCTSPHQIFDI